MKITKLAAAEEPLDTAARLYFTTEAYISVHTLCMAAMGILNPMMIACGETDLSGAEMVLPEYKDQMRATFHEAANFFKHAGRDSAAELEFRPKTNDLQLALACYSFRKITGRSTPPMDAAMIWASVHYPRILRAPHIPALDELRKRPRSMKRCVLLAFPPSNRHPHPMAGKQSERRRR